MSTLKVSNIQHENTSNGGISIDSSGHVSVEGQSLPSAGPLSNRNLIINGAMQVAQRGTTFTSVSSGAYTLDRWQFARGTSGVFDVIQSSTAPAGFASSLKVDCTTTSTPTGTQETFIRYKFEGQNLQRLQYGTAGAQSITFSFWVRSNKTGDYGLRFFQEDASRQYATTYTVSSADTWEKKTITIPGDTAGTINNDTGVGIELRFYLQAGPDRAGTPAETWNTDTDNRSTDLNLGDSTDNEWLLSGVQLEVGSVATPFEHRSYGDELLRCMRYFERQTFTENQFICTGITNVNNTGQQGGVLGMLVEKRASATITGTAASTFAVNWLGNQSTCNTISFGGSATTAFLNSSTSGATGATAVVYRTVSGQTVNIDCSAEL